MQYLQRSPMSSSLSNPRVEKLLLDLEQERCRAMVAGDFERLKTILHRDLTHVHAKGQVDGFESWFSTGGVRVNYTRVERSDLQVRVIGDAALMTGRQILEAVRKDGSGNVFIDSRVMQVWVRADADRWQQLAFQTTPSTMRVG